MFDCRSHISINPIDSNYLINLDRHVNLSRTNTLHHSTVAREPEPIGTNALIPNFLSKFFVLLGYALHVFKLAQPVRMTIHCLPNLTLFDVQKYFRKRLLGIGHWALGIGHREDHLRVSCSAFKMRHSLLACCHRSRASQVARPTMPSAGN